MGILEYLGSKNRPRSGRFWGRSWGEFQGLFRRRIPLKGRKSGDVGVEKWVQKRARSDLLRALLRVSLFERFYARLKSDVIIVSQEKSLYLYYSVLNPVRQAESAKFG